MPDGPNIQANYLDGLQEGYRFAQSEVPTIVMEMALYGINSSLSTVTAIMLLRRNTAEGLAHKWLLMVLMLMFMIATAYVVLSIVGFYQDRPGNADNLSTFLFSSARPSLLIIQAALGDSVTIWRCYEVFGKNVIVIMLPAQAIRYTNPERARPWDALRRIFGTRRKAPADSQTSTLRVDPIAVHVSTHAISVPAEAPSTDAADDMSNEDYRELDALGQQEKKVSHVLDIA
ncbi:hypothetical protein DENSPDRAFT_561369 [Dentipellis sp. KUC8613]|nr:hypothetical protein DENSPDRAFT_561369 [Dentipellis sp. KUC8613]